MEPLGGTTQGYDPLVPTTPIPFKLLEKTAKLPSKSDEDDAGWDLWAGEDCNIPVGQTRKIKLYIASAIPKGMVGLIWDRSGLASKHSMLKLAGVIDAGYRGGWQVCLHNLSDKPYYVVTGDRIAQVIFDWLPAVKPTVVEELPESNRDTKGFGSSGK